MIRIPVSTKKGTIKHNHRAPREIINPPLYPLPVHREGRELTYFAGFTRHGLGYFYLFIDLEYYLDNEDCDEE